MIECEVLLCHRGAPSTAHEQGAGCDRGTPMGHIGCIALEAFSKPLERILLKPLSGLTVLVSFGGLHFVFSVETQRKKHFFHYFVIMSSSAAGGSHFRSSCDQEPPCLATLIMCPYVQTQPFNTSHALTSSCSCSLSPFSPVAFCMLDNRMDVPALVSGSSALGSGYQAFPSSRLCYSHHGLLSHHQGRSFSFGMLQQALTHQTVQGTLPGHRLLPLAVRNFSSSPIP